MMLPLRDTELRFEWHGAPSSSRCLFLNNYIRSVKLRSLGKKRQTWDVALHSLTVECADPSLHGQR